MKNKDQAYLLFNFMQEFDESESRELGKYHIVYFYDQNGEVSLEGKKHYSNDYEIGYKKIIFKTKEQLTEFAYRFIEENHYREIYLLSTSDYNVAIESCFDATTFKQVFKDYGLCITNQKSNSLFGKIFS